MVPDQQLVKTSYEDNAKHVI